MKNKVFLGGTCCDTTWRDELIKAINSDIEYFNPVVEDWNKDCQIQEQIEKTDHCNIHLYCITKDMMGVYSIAEVVESVFQSNKITILHIFPEGFNEMQLRSLRAVVDLVSRNGGIAYIDNELHRTSRILNNCFSNM